MFGQEVVYLRWVGIWGQELIGGRAGSLAVLSEAEEGLWCLGEMRLARCGCGPTPPRVLRRLIRMRWSPRE